MILGKDKTQQGTLTVSNPSVVQTSSSTTGYISDVSIIPYIRQQMVQFAADGLRPNRRVYVFFDSIDVTDLIIKPDILTLVQNSSSVILNQGFSNGDTLIISSGNTGRGRVVQTGRYYSANDAATEISRLRTISVTNSSGEFVNTQSFATDVSGNTGTISSVVIQGGESLASFFASTPATTIRLPQRTRVMANNYWGTDNSNTITLIPRQGTYVRAMVSYISGFDNVTQTLTLSATDTLANLAIEYPTYNIPAAGDAGASIGWSIGTELYTDSEGKIAGTFSIPGGLFRTGERVFRIIDDPNNDSVDATTFAEYKFSASGLSTIRKQFEVPVPVEPIIEYIPTGSWDPGVVYPPDTHSISPTPPSTPRTVPVPPRTRAEPDPPRTPREPDPKPKPKEPVVHAPVWPTGRDSDHSDPVGQTFFVDADTSPNGLYVTSIGVYFYQKDPILPVKLTLRPTENGNPIQETMILGSDVVIPSEFVETSDTGTLETKFKFQAPIYLAPGMYAMIIQSDSTEYEVFVSEVGSTILGTDRKVSKNPYLGSFIRSENFSTWNAYQTEDLAFNLYTAEFDTTATITFDNYHPESNVYADMIYTHIDDFIVPNTAIAYAQSYDSGSTYQTCTTEFNFTPNTGRLEFASTANGMYKLRATLTSNDRRVSPYISSKSGRIIAIENFIDNANIDSDDIVITSSGSGYDANANITILLASSNGTGAVVRALANSTGHINTIIVPDGGYGYTDTITFFSANGNTGSTITAANGTGATIVINSETSPFGGPAISKYISRPVTLAEGFDAGDLRVFVTAYKPSGTNIKVYYKIKSSNDSDPFDLKNYTLMSQKNLDTLYSTKNYKNDKIEYEFEPYDTINSISYSTSTTTYNSFNQYSIKIILTSSDTTVTPILYDARAVALPGMSV